MEEKGKELYKFNTFYGYPVTAYMPVVGEKFGPWTIKEIGNGPFIGRTWGELSFPDGTVMEMKFGDGDGYTFIVQGLTLRLVT